MEEAVSALLTQRNVEEAARQAGVSAATLLRWQKLPEFEGAFREARRAAYGQAIARLQQGASAASSVLLKVLVDPNTPPATKVRAAECIFNQAAKAMELEDIQVRLALLEAAELANQERTRPPMNRNFDLRLAKLEAGRKAGTAVDIDCGWYASMLPPGYTGPREVVVVSRVQTAPHIFWCEFEERAAGVSGEPGAVR